MESKIRKLKGRINLIDFIQTYYPDQIEKSSFYQNGKPKMKMVCPFHDDNNPSMVIDEKRFHCFVCGREGDGDVIDWVMKIEKISFSKAVQSIMKRCGMTSDIPPDSDIHKWGRRLRRRIKKIQKQAEQDMFFWKMKMLDDLAERNPELHDKVLYAHYLKNRYKEK